MTFDPSADFVPDEPIRYYFDDTILVIAWKEYIEQRCCTFAEVKIAHGSQLRRKLAEDSYSSSVQLYASDMANASNAVVAMNGDFYAFSDLGITAYQRKIYRNNPAQVDSCFFTASGDMLFSRAGELMGDGEAERFINDNDIVFAVAFGPVLVDEGELQYCAGYPIGEVNVEYSRSCIAMTDKLHYLLMTINHTPDARPRATINELARIIYSKNVWKAYTLDGGQTAEIVMMGAPINHVDFGYERAVSDIIYFATAIPEEVRQ
jgi:exopolysaccharide biosynthesis protein